MSIHGEPHLGTHGLLPVMAEMKDNEYSAGFLSVKSKDGLTWISSMMSR